MVKSNPVKSSPLTPPTPISSGRREREIALLIAAVTLGLLLRDVVRDLLPGDAGEFHFAAWRWGLAHPTGYPLYLLVGGLWQHLLALVGVAPSFALNALSALFTAAAAGLFYLFLRPWLPGTPLTARLAAGVAVAFLVANPTLRTQSVQAEVYSLHLLFVVAILLAAGSLIGDSQVGDSLVGAPPDGGQGRLARLAMLLGLSFSHHATTALLVPPLLLYLFLANPNWWRPLRAWLWALPAFLLPFLLYLYIPLRSGPDASPWYHQRLGDGVLSLYTPGWRSFVDFVTGRSISVGFYSPAQAAANLPTALLLWLRHLEWPGLLLLVIGLAVLLRRGQIGRRIPLLALTLSYVLLQQTFNLFYAIDDIFVYYIPLYLMACIWIGFGAAGIGAAFQWAGARQEAREEADQGQAVLPAVRWLSTLILLALFWLPVQLWRQYTPLVQQLQAESAGARAMWEAILAAEPAPNALLVSNDRNEIVPLFYLQTIEGRAVGSSGLFPLIAPDTRFADIGATVQTALDAGSTAQPPQPVYLIKPMEGLEARFALAPAAPPLVAVLGPAASAPPAVMVDAAYGPLYLLGYDIQPAASGSAGVTVTLQWRVDASVAGDYTTTVQLFDAAGSKLGQDDRRAGGDFYPTSLWKPGELLLDRHTITLPAGAIPARLLVGMYSGPQATLLAPAIDLALEFKLPADLPDSP